MLTETDATTETDGRDETDDKDETDDRDVINIVYDKDETKIECVEETDIGQRMGHLTDENKYGKATNMGNNGERRIVRWKNSVENTEDGRNNSSSSCSGKSKDMDSQIPLSTLGTINCLLKIG